MNGQSSSRRNGSAARATKCSHIGRDDTRPLRARRRRCLLAPAGRPGTSTSFAARRGPAGRLEIASGSGGTAGRSVRTRTAVRGRRRRRAVVTRSGPLPGGGVREQQPRGPSRRAGAASRPATSPDRHERGDPLDQQQLALVDVADPGQRTLVEERLARSAVAARAGSRSRRGSPRRRRSPARGGRARARRATGGAPRRAARAARRPARRSRRRPRPGTSMTSRARRRRPAPALARPVAVPRPVHPQVRPDLQPVVEPDQEVLAERLDRGDPPTRRSGRPAARRRGPGVRAAITVRPTRYGRSPAAVRKSVSPSGIQARRSATERSTSPR